MIKNSSISYKGSWQEKTNGINENMSSVNNTSLFSQTKNNEIEFTISGLGFNIIGLKNTIDSKFDLYVNYVLVKSDISTLNDSKQFNSNLYSYFENDFKVKSIKVIIVHKDNNPLYINYIQTYGNNLNLF